MPVYGTRPEAIKMAPIIKALEASDVLTSFVTVTGQHREMLDQVNELFGIVPDHDLNIIQPRQTLNAVMAKNISGLDAVLGDVAPDAVVVQGDTTTSTAGAIAAFNRGIPVVHAEAGLRFQLVDRHPWALHREGINFVPIQAAFVTPLLLVALLAGAWRFRRHDRDGLRLLALSGGIVVLGFFLLGFFADTERVSFHWPLPGYVALLPLLPLVLAAWPRWLRVATWALAGWG